MTSERPPELTFRTLQLDDLPTVASWFAEPAVARWWNEATDLASVHAKYEPRIAGLEPTQMWVLEVDRHPAGLFQSYYHHDYPETDLAVGIKQAAGIDYLLGESWSGRGLGSLALEQFARLVLAEYPNAEFCVAAPAQANKPSWRALERAGFRRCHESQPPEEPPAFAYALDRQSINSGSKPEASDKHRTHDDSIDPLGWPLIQQVATPIGTFRLEAPVMQQPPEFLLEWRGPQRVLASAHIRLSGNDLTILHSRISPDDQQNQGIGTAVFASLIAAAKAAGLARVVAHPVPASISFWTKHGFTPTGGPIDEHRLPEYENRLLN